MNEPLVIDYYTDVLCVWAWIAQRRIDELEREWGEAVQLRHHYLNLFGDTYHRMDTQWSQKGRFDGFGDHVREVCRPFEDAPVDPRVWTQTRPTTSSSAHLMIKAVELIAGRQAAVDYALSVRRAFFGAGRDISRLAVLFEVADGLSVAHKRLQPALDDGRAMALLMRDYRQAQELNIKGSPSWVLDGGRQTLFGNVGYRVLSANIEELLRRPEEEASWC